MLHKLIMVNHGQIMLSKVPKSHIGKYLLLILSYNSLLRIFQLHVFTNCIQYFMNGYLIFTCITHEQSSNNNLFNRITVHHGQDLNPQYLHKRQHPNLRVLFSCQNICLLVQKLWFQVPFTAYCTLLSRAVLVGNCR